MVRPHPVQPLETDDQGVLRFKPNAIVKWMLEMGRSGERYDLNTLAERSFLFSDEDWSQFLQLLGYSRSGFEENSLVTDAEFERVKEAHDQQLAEEATKTGSSS